MPTPTTPSPGESPGTSLPTVTTSRAVLARRRFLAGGGALVAGAVTLTACDNGSGEEGMETPSTDAEGPTGPEVVIDEFQDYSGDHTLWQVRYELGDDEESPELFDATTQAARHEALQAKKEEQEWTAAEPLLVMDPYGTTRSGLYLYFTDAAAGEVEVTAQVAATEDFTATIANQADTGFEGLAVAMVPGAINELSLTWRPEGGDEVASAMRIKTPETATGYGTVLDTQIEDAEAISPGLFALSGISGPGNASFLYDGTGTMRAEIPSGDSPQHRVRLQEGNLVVTTGSRQVSVLDALGHAGTIIDLGDQSVHHDLEVVDGIAYVLTSKVGNERVEDRVIRVDLASGQVDEVVDLQTVFPAYEEIAHAREGGEAGGSAVTGKDWIHINSIDITDGVMVLSARETSTIIALDGALEPGGEPSVRWLIGGEVLWEGTGYEEHFLAAEGDPNGNAGQHTVHRIDDDSLDEGQFYLEMFNNNHWYLGTRDAEVWEGKGPANASESEFDGVSQVLRYLVDENAGTYSEDLMVEIPYSSVVSSVQRLGDGGIDQPMVVNSGKANEFSERTAEGELVAAYRYDSSNFGYRVYKDSFEGFWYA